MNKTEMHRMNSPMARRRFLSWCLAGLGTAMLPLPPSRLYAAQAAINVIPLTAAVFLLEVDGNNVLACNTEAGLVVVDSGSAAYSAQLLQSLDALNPRFHTLFNTHWHAEQCGSNVAIGERGATIIAHQKTWHHLSTEYYLPSEQRYQPALPAAGLPTLTFYQPGSLQAGMQHIDYGALVQPHTDADIYVYFRDANVLAAGGAVASDHDPELDWYGGGWLGGRVNSLDMLLALANDTTVIVPAKGKVMNKAQLQAERDMTQTLYNRALDLIRAGCGADCMLEEGILEGLGRQWQNPQRLLYALYKGMWAHHYNLAPNIL